MNSMESFKLSKMNTGARDNSCFTWRTLIPPETEEAYIPRVMEMARVPSRVQMGTKNSPFA